MVERITALSPVVPVGRSAAAGSGRPIVAGEELRLTLATRRADGALELQGEGVTLLLPGWPLPGEAPSPGSVLRLLVRAVTPRLELVWLDAPGSSATPEEGGAAPAWQMDQASWPRLTPERPDAAALGRDWREALLGKLAVSAARFLQEGGSHLSGALLLAAPQLALAGLRGQTLAEAPLPLTLPLWLWGGPALALSVEDAVPGPDEKSGDDTLDLLLEITLPEVGRVRLRLRLQSAGVVLVFVASAAGCRWLAAWREPIRQAVERTGLHLVACHIDEQDVLPGLALGRHGVSLLEARRVSLALFAVAAELMLLLCPPPEPVQGGVPVGLV
ncbi:hypothetical protein [Pseudogulbenkiania subflava]|uniref:Flagellar hook-length control protein FliK n=1 Tax=Pseudogulbenkiania subflava DSM 22618 TaxID=1123014 RepID=A0A1Y6BGV4_9NEIS|nr:hypothetical protein [Pseudogulbenkiania subflava]SMF07045.1 hypothetical protein SAMN02745746_01085 [Pseudogulbenkiania subflava DSM 22618]